MIKGNHNNHINKIPKQKKERDEIIILTRNQKEINKNTYDGTSQQIQAKINK